MNDSSITIVATALVEVSTPGSAIVFGTDASEWMDALSASGVTAVAGVIPPRAGGSAPDGTRTHDLRLPFVGDRRYELAVAVGVGEELPASAAPTLAASLVATADVVAFAAALPGLAPGGAPNPRWPAWWDSLFEQLGYVRHDLLRARLWADDRVDLLVRQCLTLYAIPNRFDAAPPDAHIVQTAIHPEVLHTAVTTAEAVRRSELAAANGAVEAARLDAVRQRDRGDALEGELVQARRELEAMRADSGPGAVAALERQLLEAETRADEAFADAVLLRAAIAASQPLDDLAAILPADRPIAQVKRFGVRAITAALPLARGGSRVLGANAPLFDEQWYTARYPDVQASALSPLWHYRRHGAAMHRSPHPYFDVAWYLQRNPDVARSGADPVEHYLSTGWREGRDPHPAFAGDWYATQHGLAAMSRSPLEHYLEHGRQQGHVPHPLIDIGWYLAQEPSCPPHMGVADHFLQLGWKRGFSPHALFDVRWYLETYPELAGLGMNPFIHYLGYGWREGRDPNPLFDVSWYLDNFTEVAELDVEPLRHYVEIGAAEGRATGPLFDTAWYVAQHPNAAKHPLTPLGFYLAVGAEQGHAPTPWPADPDDW